MYKLLAAISGDARILAKMWGFMQAYKGRESEIFFFGGNYDKYYQSFFSLFCLAYRYRISPLPISYALSITSYDEIVTGNSAFSQSDIEHILPQLKETLLIYASAQLPNQQFHLSAPAMLFRSLHDLLGYRPGFVGEKVWTLENMKWVRQDPTVRSLLAEAPFLAPFEDRYRLFQDFLRELRMGDLAVEGGLEIKLRRDTLFEGAYHVLDSDDKVRMVKKVRFCMKNPG